MYKNFTAVFFSTAFALMMILFPSTSVNAVSDALKLWALTVVPSLLPFFICSNFMYEIGFTDKLAAVCEPGVRKIFRTSGECAFPFIMSLVSGYPVGVKIITEARLSGSLSKTDAEKGISFCSTSGPLFMIGAVGAGMLCSEVMGWTIALSHYTGAVLNGIFFGRIMKNERGSLTELPSVVRKRHAEDINYNSVLGRSIMDSVSTLFLIGGYMAVFMMVIYFIEMMTAEMPPWYGGLLELSVGCRDTAAYVYYTEMQKTVICTAMISFGGLCVLFQSMSFIGRSDISIKTFLLSKVTHCIFSTATAFILCRVIYAVKPQSLGAFAYGPDKTVMEMGSTGFIYNLLFSGGMVCFLSIIFILIVTFYGIGVNINRVLKKYKNRR